MAPPHPRSSASYARKAAGVAASVGYVTVRGDKHAMLRHAGSWTQLSTAFTRAVLIGTPPNESADTRIAKVVEEALVGRSSLVV